MAKWFVLLFLVVVHAAACMEAARVFPGYLADEKSSMYVGGLGAMSGFGNNGMPFGGVGAGLGSMNGGNFNGAVAYAGTGPNGAYSGYGRIPGHFTTVGNLPNGVTVENGGFPTTGGFSNGASFGGDNGALPNGATVENSGFPTAGGFSNGASFGGDNGALPTPSP